MTNATTADLDPAITAAARAVAGAEDAAQRATAAARAAENATADARGRLYAIEGERRVIVERRGSGDRRPDDGALLALHAADIEAFQGVIAGLDATAAEAVAEARRAVQTLDVSRLELRRAEARMAEGHLTENAKRLSALLVQNIAAMRAARDVLGGGRLPWVPERELMDKLVPLDLGRAW